ncbi:putative T7SS-secreted protein [Streptomyces sp. NPDC000151]|uniref:putative T7SS-secreted protein n=1 Tax=Streptomyces sp. NPDC000151 TaxID=3154244 RepID=UPI00331B70BC
MGWDDWIPDGVKDGVNDVADKVGDAYEDGQKAIGRSIDHYSGQLADTMDDAGWDSGADWVRSKGDSVANHLGAEVEEWQLGETEDPKKLVHGSVGKIRATAKNLTDFQKAFDKVASGMRQLDSGEWRGKAADSFRKKFAMHPTKWAHAADACEKASKALSDFAETVDWAQQQAQVAINEYKKGQEATDKARAAHAKEVTAYGKDLQTYKDAQEAGKDPGKRPTDPGGFTHDPGKALRDAAKDKLKHARTQRNTAGAHAVTQVDAALAHAPTEPEFTDRLGMEAYDKIQGAPTELLHTVGGFTKGAFGLASFTRSISPMDSYNISHPAEYAMTLNSTAAGLVGLANHPERLPAAVVGTGWSHDRREAEGRLAFDVLLDVLTGGAGAAASAGSRTARLARLGEDAGESALRREGREAVEDAGEGSARRHLDEDGPHQSDTETPHRESADTDPVDLATGKMYLPQTDIVLPGALPLVFSRQLESGRRTGRWFGPSWASTADQRLEVDAEGVVFVSEDGLLLSYPHPVPGVPTLPVTGPRRPLERTPDGGYTLTDPHTGHVRHFSPPSDGDEAGNGVAHLDQITDRNGDHWITFDRDEDGTPTGVVHSAGYHLKLTTEDGRITALHLAGAAEDGTDQQLLRYDYTDGNLTSVINSSGLPLRFEYDDRYRVVSWTDSNDRRYDYTYDDQDRCIAEGGTEGHLAVRISYDATDPETGHRITALTDSLGHTTRYLVDDRYKIVAEISPTGAVTRTERDSHGRPVSVTNPLGHTASYTYTATGELAAVTRPDDTQVTAEYNELGLPTRVTEPDGAVWRQTYDEAGRRTSVIDPAGAVTTFAYDDRGHLASITDAAGHTTHVRCDAAGLPQQITDPLGGVTAYVRDAFGRVVSHTDPLGATTRYIWTVEGHLSRRTAPDGATESWTYDGEGNCLTHTDAAGGVTRFEYTHFDQLVARTDPNGVRYTFTYDTKLQLSKVTNPQGLEWSYAYDPAGLLLSETDFDGRQVSYERDSAGRLAARTSPLGDTTVYQYDKLGRTSAKRTSDGVVTRYSHDASGRPLRAATSDCEVIWQRDALGRVTAESVNGRTMSHAYDVLGRRIHRRTPTGAEATYAYDAASRRTSLTTSGRTLDFTHDAAGQEISRHLTGGLITLHQSWDATGRLASQSLYGTGTGAAADPDGASTGSAPLQHRSYAYRPDGYLTAIDDQLNGPRRFTLDSVGHVTAVSAHNWTETYAYDEAGNQTQAEWPTTHANSEATGARTYTGTRLTQAGRIRYEHDAAGRMTVRQKRHLSGKRETWHYTWDTEDRLTSVTTPDGTTWRYLYDPLGRRTAKQRLSSDGTTVLEQVDFTWDGATLTEQTTSASESTPAITLTWDHNGLAPLAQTERITAADAPQSEIDSRFFAIITDLVGTPTELVSPNGEIAWRTRTTLWGTTTWNADATAYTPLRFPGQYFDPETGLHYNCFRYYDPGTARYLSPDPLGLSPAPNPAAYVHNPMASTDVLGLAPCPPDQDRRAQPPAHGEGNGNDWAKSVTQKGRTDNSQVISGHGYYEFGAGDMTVPSGTWLKFYVEDGQRLSDAIGHEVEVGGNRAPFETFGPGKNLPDYTVDVPKNLNISSKSITVNAPTRLSDIVTEGMGAVHVVICREHIKPW